MEVARSASTPMAIPQASQVAPPGARDAADGFSQVSTRDLKPSVATPPAAGASQTTVAEPAPPPVEAGQAKPPPQGGANGSTAAGSPSAPNSEKAPPAAVAAPLDAAATAAEPPKRAPLVAAPLLDPPRTYEKDAKTILWETLSQLVKSSVFDQNR